MGGRRVALPVLRMRRNSNDLAADRIGADRQRRDWGIWGYREAGSPDQSAWGELTPRGYQTGPSSLVGVRIGDSRRQLPGGLVATPPTHHAWDITSSEHTRSVRS